ncbi:hypothetical protein QW180_27750 [Vibrio sinaloensis]|nr:hypothetical protein [Vibrio sinaloensis]
MAQHLLNDPVEVQLQSAEASTLVQRVFSVNKGQKNSSTGPSHQTTQMASDVDFFVNAKNACNHLAQKLSKRGITAEVFPW